MRILDCVNVLGRGTIIVCEQFDINVGDNIFIDDKGYKVFGIEKLTIGSKKMGLGIEKQSNPESFIGKEISYGLQN